MKKFRVSQYCGFPSQPYFLGFTIYRFTSYWKTVPDGCRYIQHGTIGVLSRRVLDSSCCLHSALLLLCRVDHRFFFSLDSFLVALLLLLIKFQNEGVCVCCVCITRPSFAPNFLLTPQTHRSISPAPRQECKSSLKLTTNASSKPCTTAAWPRKSKELCWATNSPVTFFASAVATTSKAFPCARAS